MGKAAKPDADYWVAIQGTLLEATVPPIPGTAPSLEAEVSTTEFFDVNWLVLEQNMGNGRGERTVVPSCGVWLPEADVENARARQERGLEGKTAAQVTSERLGFSDGRDPYAFLTAGRRSREVLLTEALAVALGQLERQRHSQPPATAPPAVKVADHEGQAQQHTSRMHMPRWAKRSQGSSTSDHS